MECLRLLLCLDDLHISFSSQYLLAHGPIREQLSCSEFGTGMVFVRRWSPFFLQTCKLIWCQRVKFKSNLSLILGGSFLMSHWEVQTSGGPRQVPCGAGGPGGRGRMSKVLHQFDFKEVFNSVQVLYSKTKFGNKKQFSSKVIKSELTWDLLKYKWSKTNRKVISLCKQLQLYSISLWTNISSSE